MPTTFAGVLSRTGHARNSEAALSAMSGLRKALEYDEDYD